MGDGIICFISNQPLSGFCQLQSGVLGISVLWLDCSRRNFPYCLETGGHWLYNAGTSARAPFVCQLELSGSGWLRHSIGKRFKARPRRCGGTVIDWLVTPALGEEWLGKLCALPNCHLCFGMLFLLQGYHHSWHVVVTKNRKQNKSALFFTRSFRSHGID